MKSFSLAVLLLLAVSLFAFGQTNARPQATPAPATNAAPRVSAVDLTEYGVSFQPDPRLIIMMAALDAAGFDPTPAGRQPSELRADLRKMQANVSEALRQRMRSFYENNKYKEPDVTPAQQAARYVSLALALGPPPALEAPERSDDLPADVLEVLDFAPLVREFYRAAALDERLPSYVALYKKQGDALRLPTAEMVRAVLSYLHMRPLTVALDRVPAKAPEGGNKKKKTDVKAYTVREKERRFVVVPDLLAAPGAINLRVIADDYFLIVPPSARMNGPEVRRSYLRYVIDPLVLRFNREISARRDVLRQLVDERQKATTGVLSADVFPAVTQSLIVAADARMEQTAALESLARETAARLQRAKEPERPQISKEAQERRQAIEDETTLQLAEAYEGGAVLAFYFAEQLRGIETSGFDVSNVFADMIASFDVAKEKNRLTEAKESRERAVAARARREKELAAARESGDVAPGDPNRARLITRLGEIEDLLNLKNYQEAETRLRGMTQEFPGEPRVFFALGQAYSLAARDAFDENLQAQRLDRAAAFYRQAAQIASRDTDAALLSRTHEALGRILAFLDKPQEAAQEFDAAIAIGPVAGGAHKEALAGKAGLTAKP